MTFEFAIRATEVMLALAFLQSSSEHLIGGRRDFILFLPRVLLSGSLLFGLFSPWVLLALFTHSLILLHRFQGPYNGGSDRMGLLILSCLCLAHWCPTQVLREAAFGYLAVQVALSYFVSGQVKIMNPEWRSGRALQDVFLFSAYPVSEALRSVADHRRPMLAASWSVMLFEVMFPLAFVSYAVLIIALSVAAVFHLANACLFGLNRFAWIWPASYPSILWLQERLL